MAFVPQWSTQARPALEAALHGPNGLDLASLLASREEAWAEALTVQCLNDADASLRMGAVRGLRRGPPPPVRRALVHLASCDPSAVIKAEARQFLKSLNLEWPIEACAVPAWRSEPGVVMSATERVQLLEGSNLPPCEGNPQGALGLLDQRCLVASNFGEWGGVLGLAWDGGAALITRDSLLQAVAVLREDDSVRVMSSLGHMSGSGGVGHLSPQGDGGLEYAWDLRFLAQPTAWAVSRGRLFVEFGAEEMVAPCKAKSARERVVMVYERDGGWSLASGASTRCLWDASSP